MKAMQLLYRPVQGGMETLAASLHDSMRKSDIQVNTETLESNATGAASMWSRAKKASELIQLTKPSVILSHSTIPNFYARLAASTNIPVVCVLHSANDEWNNPRLRFAEWMLQRRTTAVVAVSARKSAEYARRFPHSAYKVHVIPNGIRPPATLVPERSDVPQLLFAGRVTPQKNLLCLLKACLEMSNRGFRFKLLIAGQEPDEAYSRLVRDFIASNRMFDYVQMLGVREDVPSLMARADLLVHPSLAEAHSLTLLEAAAQGLPAIVSRFVYPTLDSRMVVVVYDGETVADLVQKLSLSLADLKALRVRSAGNAQALFRDYSIESTTTKYIELLSEVVAEAKFKVGW